MRHCPMPSTYFKPCVRCWWFCKAMKISSLDHWFSRSLHIVLTYQSNLISLKLLIYKIPNYFLYESDENLLLRTSNWTKRVFLNTWLISSYFLQKKKKKLEKFFCSCLKNLIIKRQIFMFSYPFPNTCQELFWINFSNLPMGAFLFFSRFFKSTWNNIIGHLLICTKEYIIILFWKVYAVCCLAYNTHWFLSH